jgi:catechol 2,3-dioxygenase-like lactoylglutathione lyase family enzyme
VAYKVFVNGFPLNASELNTYLMKQSIAVFVDATARDAAIETPVDGQFAYLTGTDSLVKYNGSAWVDAISIPEPTISEQTGTSYTIVSGDANSTILVNNAAQVTITVADVLTAGQRIDFVQKGAGQIQFDPDTDVNLYSAGSNYLSAEQYVGISIVCEASNEYYLIGNLTT